MWLGRSTPRRISLVVLAPLDVPVNRPPGYPTLVSAGRLSCWGLMKYPL
jgi:hypothetical protein